MAKYPPDKFNEVIKLLENLRFRQVKRTGIGGHSHKFNHPKRKMGCEGERPFIIVPHRMYKQLSEKICKKLLCYEFSIEEIKECCKAI